MKSQKFPFSIVLLTILYSCISSVPAQKNGLNSINISDLQTHLYFLASDELKGRATGEPGIDIAARYLAVQARKIGLTPIDEDKNYYQFYTLEKKKYNLDSTYTLIKEADKEPYRTSDKFYFLAPPASESITIEGEIVFAGYGINSESNNYNDFLNIDVKDKMVMIMNRAPMDEEGKECLFKESYWTGLMNFRYKYPYIESLQPKAILMVYDPKSGINSLEDFNPTMARYVTSSISLKNDNQSYREESPSTKLILIHRNLANKLLDGTGYTLEGLQHDIDRSLKPRSFAIPEKSLKMHLEITREDFTAPNVIGMVEGSDPEMKEEVVLYMAHFDHIGTDEEGNIYNGADDNASGSVALLEVAEAFVTEKIKPKRSIVFLWVSGEEIGLFGSRYYTSHPVIPLEQTVTVINLDMVGRTKTAADTGYIHGEKISVLSGDTIGLIGALQSQELMDIHQSTLVEMNMACDYKFNDPDHPYRYFYRSDHINFARKDVPVLFYSTGTHSDYHRATDTPDLIDYEKLNKVTRFTYMVGYRIADAMNRIVVDNPFSSWNNRPDRLP